MTDPKTWADWDGLGEDETGVILVSCEDCPTPEEAIAAAMDDARMAGLAPAPVEPVGREQHVVCHDEDHEQGMCTRVDPCNGLTDVWAVTLAFKEPLP